MKNILDYNKCFICGFFSEQENKEGYDYFLKNNILSYLYIKHPELIFQDIKVLRFYSEWRFIFVYCIIGIDKIYLSDIIEEFPIILDEELGNLNNCFYLKNNIMFSSIKENTLTSDYINNSNFNNIFLKDLKLEYLYKIYKYT